MPHRPPGAWVALALTLAIQALVAMAVLTVPAMGPAMAEALGVSPTLVGTFVAVVYLGAMAASLLSGPLVVRYGAIRVSQAGLLLCAAGLALLAVAPGLATTAAGALLVGLGYGPITPASSHLLARTTPPHRISLVFSVKQTGVPLGGVLAGALVPALLLAGGVQAALLAVAAANLLCAVLSQPLRGPLDADRQPAAPLSPASLLRPIRLVVGDRGLRGLAAMSFAFAMVQLCLATYLVTYLHDTLGYGLVAAGAVLSAAQVGGVVGRVAWGWVADRWLTPRQMLATLAALMAVCSAATAALPAGAAVAAVLVLMTAFGACGTGWNGVYLAEVSRLAPPGQASAATGGALSVTFFGVVLGPVLFGALSGALGSYRAGYLALALPAAVCAWRLVRGGRPAGQPV